LIQLDVSLLRLCLNLSRGYTEPLGYNASSSHAIYIRATHYSTSDSASRAVDPLARRNFGSFLGLSLLCSEIQGAQYVECVSTGIYFYTTKHLLQSNLPVRDMLWAGNLTGRTEEILGLRPYFKARAILIISYEGKLQANLNSADAFLSGFQRSSSENYHDYYLQPAPIRHTKTSMDISVSVWFLKPLWTLFRRFTLRSQDVGYTKA
jgi:hypothetical protein